MSRAHPIPQPRREMDAPASDGGSPIICHTIAIYGTPYSFTVSARNAASAELYGP